VSCDLCTLIENIDAGTCEEAILHNDSIFIAVYCNNPAHPNTPMAVLRRHAADPKEEELAHLYAVMNEKYPDRKARGAGRPTIPDHFHEHWVTKEGA